MDPLAGGTAELLRRYDRPGPRYTSYPTAVEFHAGFGEAEYRARLAEADARAGEPLSLYAHLPFCEERCHYCGCNVVATRHRDVAERYLATLETEIGLLARHLPRRRTVSQMHWGGGTPTYYSPDELERVFRAFAGHFAFTPDAELSIEVDPRVTSAEHVERLRALGFNRISMGVQDLSPEVQVAIGRVQSYEVTRELVERSRAAGFHSINLDLVYGLPHQERRGFRTTLERIIGLRPDRLAIYSFAYLPHLQHHQKRIAAETLPPPDTKLHLLALAIDTLTAAGYRQIGMDHFALPGDELARAVEARTLHRNFMGYTVQSARDMLAVGISGIGDVQGAFVQNFKKLPEWAGALGQGRFPVARGYALDDDDRLRRHVITRLMCNGHLDVREVERTFGIDFAATFAAELAELSGPDSPVTDGLLEVTPDALQVTTLGGMFVRNVCMAFDRHLREARAANAKPAFSRTV